MEQKKRNKNALRSRKLIIDAYSELLETHSANKITVTKIVETADLNRSTFYAHFTSPSDVLAAIEEDVMNKFKTLLNQVQLDRILEQPLPLVREIAKLVNDNRELFIKLIKDNRESRFLEKLKEVFIEKLMSDTETLKLFKDRTALDINLRFLAGGYMETIRDWFNGNLDIPIEQLSQITSRTITECLHSCMT